MKKKYIKNLPTALFSYAFLERMLALAFNSQMLTKPGAFVKQTSKT